MHENPRHFSFARITGPVELALTVISAVLIATFFISVQNAELVAAILPVVVFACCLSFLFVPQKNLSFLVIIALGLSIPFSHFAAFTAMGEGIQWGHLFGILLIIHMAIRLLIGNRLPIAPATPWAIAFAAASFLSLFAVISLPYDHIIEFWKSEVQLLFAIVLMISVTHVKVTERQILLVLKSMILLSVAVALFGIYQLPARFFGLPGGVLALANPSLSAGIQSTVNITYLFRSSSIFSEPGYLGHYMIGMIALSLTAALHRSRLFGRPIVIWGILFIQVAGLIVSSSIGSYYIFAELLVLMFLLERRVQRNKIIITLLIIFGIGAALMALVKIFSGFNLWQYLSERAIGLYMFFREGGDTGYLISGESAFERVQASKVAYNIWQDYPVIGVGLGSYTIVSLGYGNWRTGGYSANTLLNVLAETGIIGFTAFLGIMISNMFGLWRIFTWRFNRSRTNVESATFDNLQLIARMVFYLVLVEVLYFHVIGSLFWINVWFYFGLGGLVTVTAWRQLLSNKQYNTNPEHQS